MSVGFKPQAFYRRFPWRWMPAKVAGGISAGGEQYGIRDLSGGREFRTLSDGRIRTFATPLTVEDRCLPNGDPRTTPAGDTRTLGESQNAPIGIEARCLPNGDARTTPAGNDRTLGSLIPVSDLNLTRCLPNGDTRTLIDSARSLRLDLQTTTDPEFAFGSGAPTFVRNTSATVEGADGLITEVASHVPRFKGARPVINLIDASEDMTDAAYAVGSNAVVDSATQVTYDGTPDGEVKQTITLIDDGSGVGGRTFVFSCKVKLISGTVSSDDALQIILGGNAVASTLVNIGNQITSSAQRFTVTASTDAGGTDLIPVLRWDDAGVLEITEWLLEESTGRADTTTPSEYASTGVAEGPEIILAQKAAQYVVTGTNTKADAADGSVLITHVDNSAGANFFFDADEGVTVGDQIVGRSYVLSGEAKVGAGDSVLVTLNGGATSVSDTITSTSYVPFTLVQVVEAANLYRMHMGGMGAGETINVRNVSLRLATTGVQNFKYANGNTVSSNIVTESPGAPFDATDSFNTDRGPFGYLAEGQRTNLALRSRTWQNASWSKTTVTANDNEVVGVDGRTRAASLTASSGNGTVIQDLGVIASAAKAWGLWIKRKTGTGNIDLTLNGGSSWTTITVTDVWTRVEITATLADPDIGIRIVTNADAIYVDFAQCEAATFLSSTIPETEGTAVTRNADVLTYPDTGNIQDAAGTAFAEASTEVIGFPDTYHLIARTSNGRIIAVNSSNNIIFVDDGPNISVSPAGISMFGSVEKVASTWGTALTAYSPGTLSPDASPASYDGGMGAGDIGIGHRGDGNQAWYGTISFVELLTLQFNDAEVLDPSSNPAYADAVLTEERTIGPTSSPAINSESRCLPNGDARTTPAGNDRTLDDTVASLLIAGRTLPSGAARSTPSGLNRTYI